MEVVGTYIANAYSSIFLVSHLYVAIGQLALLRTQWQQICQMISLHMPTLFKGEIPCDEIQTARRFATVLGLNPSQIHRSKRTRSKADYRVNRLSSPHLPCNKTTDTIRKLAAEKNPITMVECLGQINGLMKESLIPKSNGKRKKRPQLTSLQLLRRLRDWMPEVVKDMQIDYISLNLSCTELLHRIYHALLKAPTFSFPTFEDDT